MARNIDTLALHAGARHFEGAIATPVFRSSTYEMEEGTDYGDIRYARLSNSPNHEVLHDRLASIMMGEAALTCASGMAAISTTLDELIGSGGTLLVASTLYGGTAGLLNRWVVDGRVRLERFDAANAAIRVPDTDVLGIYVESVANPTMVPTNLPAVVELSQKLAVPLVVDNTFCSPIGVRPLELGADLVVHSATKYLNGHSDVTAGVIAGRSELVSSIRTRLAYNGAMLDPGAAYLLERGLKTLGVRVRQQQSTAEKLVGELRRQLPNIEVSFPRLGDAPWLDGPGAMFSFELPSDASADLFFDALEYFTYAPSLGGVESLIIRPAFGSHAGLTKAERELMGVSERLVRVSVGLENYQDLERDLFSALESARVRL